MNDENISHSLIITGQNELLSPHGGSGATCSFANVMCNVPQVSSVQGGITLLHIRHIFTKVYYQES